MSNDWIRLETTRPQDNIFLVYPPGQPWCALLWYRLARESKDVMMLTTMGCQKLLATPQRHRQFVQQRGALFPRHGAFTPGVYPYTEAVLVSLRCRL